MGDSDLHQSTATRPPITICHPKTTRGIAPKSKTRVPVSNLKRRAACEHGTKPEAASSTRTTLMTGRALANEFIGAQRNNRENQGQLVFPTEAIPSWPWSRYA